MNKKQRRMLLTGAEESITINLSEGCPSASKTHAFASDKCKDNLHLVKRGGQPLTQKAQKSLKSLSANTARYSGAVQRTLSKSNRKPNSALVASAAKYYLALKKLADG